MSERRSELEPKIAAIENDKKEKLNPSEALEFLGLNSKKDISWKDIENALLQYTGDLEQDKMRKIIEDNIVENALHSENKKGGDAEMQNAIENFFGNLIKKEVLSNETISEPGPGETIKIEAEVKPKNVDQSSAEQLVEETKEGLGKKSEQKKEKVEHKPESDFEKVRTKLEKINDNSTAILNELQIKGVSSNVELLKKYLDASDREKLKAGLNEEQVQYLIKQCQAVMAMAQERMDILMQKTDPNDKEKLKELSEKIKKKDIKKRIEEAMSEEEKAKREEGIQDEKLIALHKRIKGAKSESERDALVMEASVLYEELNGEDLKSKAERIAREKLLLDGKIEPIETEKFLSEEIKKSKLEEKTEVKEICWSHLSKKEQDLLIKKDGDNKESAKESYYNKVKSNSGLSEEAFNFRMLESEPYRVDLVRKRGFWEGFFDKGNYSGTQDSDTFWGTWMKDGKVVPIEKEDGFKYDFFTTKDFEDFQKISEKKARAREIEFGKEASQNLQKKIAENNKLLKDETNRQLVELIEKAIEDKKVQKAKDESKIEPSKKDDKSATPKIEKPESVSVKADNIFNPIKPEVQPILMKPENAPQSPKSEANPSSEKRKSEIISEIKHFLSIDDENFDKEYVGGEILRLRRKYSEKNKEELDEEELKNFDKVRLFLSKIRKLAGKKPTIDYVYDILKKKLEN